MESLKSSREKWSWEECVALGLQEFQALLIDYKTKSVLLKKESSNYVLPGYLGDIEEYSSTYLPEFIVEKLREIVAPELEATVLREVWKEQKCAVIRDEDWVMEKAVVLIDYINGNVKARENYIWFPVSSADVYHHFQGARTVIRDELKIVKSGIYPSNRLDWQRPGWFKAIKTWMRDSLERDGGDSVVEHISFERLSPYGVVIEVSTSSGSFFLKCTHPNANDAAYTSVLSQLAPAYVTAPTAVWTEKRLMITPNYGLILEPYEFDREDSLILSADYAKFQKRTMGKTNVLERAGMPNMSLDVLPEVVSAALSTSFMSQFEKDSDIGGAVDFLRHNWKDLEEDITELRISGIDSTVTHNDLFLSNVYRASNSKNFMFFDFVDGYIGHPFTSSLSGLDQEGYLKEWLEYGTVEELRRFLNLGRRLQSLIKFILCLQEASTREAPERQECIDSARTSLLFICKSVQSGGGETQ